MKVLMVNGSPHREGCTYTALREVGAELEKNGVETEIFWLGDGMVRGCIDCGGCDDTDRCLFTDDAANALIEAIQKADGVVVGSPVYYAGPNGALCAVLDRAFYAAGGSFEGKPAAAVVSCRRAGSTAALDRLNKYFMISRMPVVSSQYWNMVHGNRPEDVAQDAEGLQIMRTLGANMAAMLRALDAGSWSPPPHEKHVWTSFIR